MFRRFIAPGADNNHRRVEFKIGHSDYVLEFQFGLGSWKAPLLCVVIMKDGCVVTTLGGAEGL